MKKLVLTSFIILIMTQITLAQWMSPEVDSLLRYVVDKTNLDTLINYVNVLSGEDSVTINNSRYLISSRNAFYPGNNLAAEFIYQTLLRTGLPTYNQDYSTRGRNVFSIQTGIEFPDQEFIICAHYDDMPAIATAPGADDNASGTAAVLEAARIISKIQTPYTIIYALWDEEEIGYLGSKYYATQAHSSGEKILGVINLDMIAWNSDTYKTFNLHSNPVGKSYELARLGGVLSNYFNFDLVFGISSSGEARSDHGNFWEQGFSAILIQEDVYDFNSYYHSSNDRINAFDLDYFLNISKLANSSVMFLGLNGLTSGNINSSITTLDRTYAKFGTDSILFRIKFPLFSNDQMFTAHLICSNVFETGTDSLTLFDDGLHGDLSSGDGIFGVYIPPRMIEDFYSLGVSTIDQQTNRYIYISQMTYFTTVGPVVLDSVLTRKYTQSKYDVQLFLKNNSESKSIYFGQVKLLCDDPWAKSVIPSILNLPNLGPGETVTRSFNIETTDTLFHSNFNLTVEVFSYELPFWYDSITVNVTGIQEELIRPTTFKLEQNYPNPFNSSTSINYSIPKTSLVTLKVFDVLGREIATLVGEEKPAGNYEVKWNAEGISSGIYFYKLQAADFVQTKKMILLK